MLIPGRYNQIAAGRRRLLAYAPDQVALSSLAVVGPKTGGPFLFDRIKETCSSPGLGPVTLLGVVAQFHSFSAKIPNGGTVVYEIQDQAGGPNWEIQLGTYALDGGPLNNTLSRTAANVLDGSSGPGVLVNFSTGTQNVFCDLPAAMVSPTNIGYNVKLFGAKGDALLVKDGTMTAGSAVLNTLTPYFTSGDAGKVIGIKNAGAAGKANFLITTILSYQSSTQVTLNTVAANSVVGAEVYWGTDDATAINAATLAASLSGGVVFFPAGTYFIGSAITWYTHTHLIGSGPDTTVLMLKPGASTDIIQSDGFATWTGANKTKGVFACSIRDLSIDGRSLFSSNPHTVTNATLNPTDTTLTVLDTSAFPSNGTLINYDKGGLNGEVVGYSDKTATTFTGLMRQQENTVATTQSSGDYVDLRSAGGIMSSGYGIRVYGRDYILDNVRIHDCQQDGLYSEWATAAGNLDPDSMPAHITNLKVHECQGNGIYFAGPHDSQLSIGNIYVNNLIGVRLVTNAVSSCAGVQINEYHVTGQQVYGVTLEGQSEMYNCLIEQAVFGQAYVLVNGCIIAATKLFATPTQLATGRGLLLGNASVTVSQTIADVLITGCNGGSIDFTGDTGSNYIRANIAQNNPGGGNFVIGTPHVASNVQLTVQTQNFNAFNSTQTQLSAPAVLRSLYAGLPVLQLKKPNLQTSNILEAQDSTNAALTVIDKNGQIGINQNTPTFGQHQVGGSQRLVALGTPATPTGTAFGGSGTNNDYFVVAKDSAGNKTLASAKVTISGGAALSSSVWNRVAWTAVTGAYSYDILKTNTTTLLATVTPVGGGNVTRVAVGAGGSGYTGSAPLIGFSGPASNMPVATSTVTGAGALSAIAMSASGNGQGFTSAPTVVIGGPGNGAAATANMGVSDIASVANGGTGYAVNDLITLTGGTFATATVFQVTAVSAGVVTAIAVKILGSYSVIPSDPVAQGSTTGAGSGATFNCSWGVASVTITNGGSGYTSAPSIGFSGGGALPTSVAILAASAVTGISISAGTGLYTGAPTVVVQGVAAGSGATATASLSALSYDDIGSGTSGYTNPLRNATADTTIDGEVIIHNGLTAGNVLASGTIFTATADAVSNTNNTTVSLLGTGVGTKTLPVNFFIAGRGIRIRIKGRMTSTVTTPCLLTFLVKLGSTTICTSLSVGPSTAVTSLAFEGECDIMCRTVGTSGTVYGQGVCRFYNSATVMNSWGMPATAVATIDTTATQVVDFQCTQSNVTNPQTLTITNATIEVLN